MGDSHAQQKKKYKKNMYAVEFDVIKQALMSIWRLFDAPSQVLIKCRHYINCHSYQNYKSNNVLNVCSCSPCAHTGWADICNREIDELCNCQSVCACL